MDYHIKGTHNFYLIGFLWIPRKSVSKGNLESAYFIWSCCHVFKFANHGIIFNFGVLSLSSSWYRSYLLKLSWIIMGHIMPNHRILSLEQNWNYCKQKIHKEIHAFPFYKKRSYKKRPILFFNHRKPWPIEFSIIRNDI